MAAVPSMQAQKLGERNPGVPMGLGVCFFHGFPMVWGGFSMVLGGFWYGISICYSMVL